MLSPIDVILDRDRALVLQPDLIFVSTARLDICRDRIWGAPDLVIEVLSASNRSYDCTTKVRWYREYGVREYWMVDPDRCRFEVLDLPAGTGGVYRARQVIRSGVLPRLRLRPADISGA